MALMKTIADLSNFILSSLRDEDSGRVALYHYLRNFQDSAEPLTPSTINAFYAEALHLNHWQAKKAHLHDDVQELLQRFFSGMGQPFRLDEIWDLHALQLVLLENAEDLSQVVQEYEISQRQEGEKIRTIMEGARGISIKKLTNGGLVVRTYGNLARIVGNKLAPLSAEQELFYDSSLDLLPRQIQKLKPTAHSQIRFVVDDEEIEAQFISGFAFRQTQRLRIPGLAHEPRIFYPLKRLERYFVHRPSDPYYMEILGTLDRAIHLLRSHADSAETFALQAFDSGQIAFDQIFPDDKAMHARLKELAKLISAFRRPQRPSLDRPKELTF